MAPILSFTAEEAWRIVHPGRSDHLRARLGRRAAGRSPTTTALIGEMGRASSPCARRVQKELEALRQSGEIGSSLQAEVAIAAPADDYAALASLGDDLRFVMITSARDGRRAVTRSPCASRRARIAKCERCWHWRADVGADPAHPTLCARCVANLFGSGEPRRFA